ncbi:MAG: transketolase, partial [Chloroflexota bacterium]
STEDAFTEDRAARFKAYGWHVQVVDDGNDLGAIDKAISSAKSDLRPSIIVARTIIGFGLPTKAGTSKAHGEPPGEDELAAAKAGMRWPEHEKFYIPGESLEHFRGAIETGKEFEADWAASLIKYKTENIALAEELEQFLGGELPQGWEKSLPVFPPDDKGMATRVASGRVINAIAESLPGLMGGSADLAPSTKTWIEGSPAFQSKSPQGRNFHFGVREHGMGAVVNGMTLYPGIIPYGATFLVFSDYMRPAIRLSALSHFPSIWVFTHDSIGLGEDGPTHQPVEHLAALRAIPNLTVIRPGDANETMEAWRYAIANRKSPTALLLTRQGLPTLDREKFASASGLAKGAYVLADMGEGDPEFILMASGSEEALIIEAGAKLVEQGKSFRLVSFPSWELFVAQPKEYRDGVLLPNVKNRLAVEAGISQGWTKWVGDQGRIIAVDKYGASAPANILFREYGFTVDNVLAQLNEMVD